MASYPSAIKTFVNPIGTNTTNSPAHATQHSDANDEINAIETELGLDPAGSYATVKARLDDLPNILVDITNNQTIAGKKVFTGTLTTDYGANVASANNITLGDDGNVFKITGTTTIGNIDIKTIGTIVHLIFEDVLTLTDGGNIDILGDFTTYAGASITLVSDGTNWVELHRSLHTLVKRWSYQTGAVATGTTAIPFDDTIPQNDEGDQYMTLAVTPSASTNILRIDVIVNISHSAGTGYAAALFQDSTASALATTCFYAGAGGVVNLSLSHVMTAGTTSSTTFKVRAGNGGSGTTTFNGLSGSRLFGGTLLSSICVSEYKP